MRAESVSLQDLIDTVIERAEKGDELDRIQQAGLLSEQVATLTEQLLDYFVQDARRAGLSWSQIGGRLGITKQGAQQRFTHQAPGKSVDLSSQLVALGLPPLEESQAKASSRGLLRHLTGNVGVRRFTQAARQVIMTSHEEALRLGSDSLGTEHLLLGLLGEQAGLATGALQAVGVDRESIAAKVVAISRNGPNDSVASLPLTLGTTRTLETAMREAMRLGHHYIGTEHVLLGLLAADNTATEILASLGTDPYRLGEQVLGLLERS